MFQRFIDMKGADKPLNDHRKEGDHEGRPYLRFLRSWPMVVGLAVALCFASAVFCNPAPAAAPGGNAARTLLVDGRQVPIFPTPEEQLRYARSTTFDETEEKSAALKALELLFPAARESSAIAALELAFLSLGDDYRLADKNQYLLARNNYLGIVEKYPDLPAVAAKALWYLGWIAADLEGDRPQGIRWFQRLITLYPQEKLSHAAPVPWLTIRPTDADQQQHGPYPKAVLTWADLAHLEIIRHTESREQAWQSFQAIQQAGAGEVFTAAALKVLVERHGFDARSEELATEYLQKADGDSALKDDLHLALSVYRRKAIALDGPR